MNHRLKSTCILLVFTALLTSLSALAQADTSNRPLYIIFDGSNSMWGELPDKSRKITVAKDVFNQIDAGLFAARDVALRLYGHRRAKDCSDTELVVPLAPAEQALKEISSRVNDVSPRGKTPINRSLIAALKDLDGRPGDILLISDGIETCDADPCELVQSWRDENINIRVHVIGLGLTDLSRSAMQCIADASGTEYLDASTAGELNNAITKTASTVPPEPIEATPQPQDTGSEFKITGVDEHGNFVPVSGTISGGQISAEEIASNYRYEFPGGQYTIVVGVPTVNGELYLPISKEIEINNTGTTKLVVNLQRPPEIRTKFIASGKEVRGVVAAAQQNGREVFKLRPGEDYFVLPGTYDFVANLNKDNQLKTTETINEGENKDIVFVAVETVHTTFTVYGEGQEKKLRQHQELWQNGELKYKVHVHNGAKIRPGVYTLKSNHALTPYEIPNVQVPAGKKQTLEFTVPVGVAKITYEFITQPKRKGRRCWLYPVDAQGKKAKNSSTGLRCDGSTIVLNEGRYFVLVWSYLGEFEDTYFDVVSGQTINVSVPQKGP